MKLYHTTTADKAAIIMLGGFRDNATVNKRMFSGTTLYKPGVWFGDVPAIDDELFDGIGLFDFDAERQVFIAVDVRLPRAGIQSSAVDSTWPGVQYWAPAAIWNECPRTLLSLDDAIRLRLPSFPQMRKWIKDYDWRDYSRAFFDRVKRILNEAAKAA